MANAYKCDFCGVLTEGNSKALQAEIYSGDAGRHAVKFLGTLSVAIKQSDYGDDTIPAEVCPACIRKFAQRIAEGK